MVNLIPLFLTVVTHSHESLRLSNEYLYGQLQSHSAFKGLEGAFGAH